ncbi:hypothetical protein DFJ74DRAFT_628657 [Hyaloraphidium curvatum]|nr:hypothetical protein DFJ74DRAFT_628657 [Hyaloraphidium curvatum]
MPCCCSASVSVPRGTLPGLELDRHPSPGPLAVNPTASAPAADALPEHVGLRPEVAEQVAFMIQTRRALHSYPEMGFQEVKTAARIREELEKLPGVKVVSGLGVTGLIGIYRGSQPGPTIAFRADMDGLPVDERAEGLKDASWISQNPGIMHACGHDGHVAMLLGAARAIVRAYPPSSFAGTIVFLFQPAEETDGGASVMLKDGLLTAGGLSDIDAFYGIHLMSGLPLGTIATKPGPLLAGIDTLEISVQGVGGHPGMPHLTVDSVLVLGHLIVQLHNIIARSIDPHAPAQITLGQVSAGTGYGSVADAAIIKGHLSYNDAATREILHKRVRAVCDGVAQSHGANVLVKIGDFYPITSNHPHETDLLLQAARKVVGSQLTLLMEHGIMGSEDFSYYLAQRPGAFTFLGAAIDSSQLNSQPHHSPLFDFNEHAMSVGAGVWMQLFEDLLVGGGGEKRAAVEPRL